MFFLITAKDKTVTIFHNNCIVSLVKKSDNLIMTIISAIYFAPTNHISNLNEII